MRRPNDWQWVRRRIMGSAVMKRVVDATLLEAEQRIRRAAPTPNTVLTYKGGTTRAANLLKKMREEEVKAP